MSNAKPVVTVTRKLPVSVEALLTENFTARLNADDRLPTADEIIVAASGADAILVCPTDRIDAALVRSLPDSIKIISTFSVGCDHIDINATTARNIVVTNTPDVLTDATADIAMLLMLGAARGAVWGEKMVRQATWKTWSPTKPLGIHVTGKRLGIVGMGRIGRAMARRAAGFDMEIHYHGRHRLAHDLENGAIFHDNLDNLLAVSDFLSLHCAATPNTRRLLDASRIEKLPDGAIVINTARGEIVDDAALIEALSSGKLAAAGLDVFSNEPDIDPRYRAFDNVFMLPHLGSATQETRDAMGHRAVDNLEAFFSSGVPGDIVKPD